MLKRETEVVSWRCPACGDTYSVSKKDSDLKLLKDKMPCIGRGCGGSLQQSRRPYLHALVVKARTLYQACEGLGTPAERKCSPAVVKKLLVGSKIVDVAVTPSSDKNRAFLTTITLEGGKTVHLAPSTKGVTVFKVTNDG